MRVIVESFTGKPSYPSNSMGERGKYGMNLVNQHGISKSLSSIGFGFSERIRKDKFPWLKNIGDKDTNEAVEYIILSSKFDDKDIAKNLNKSGISYTNWVGMGKKTNIIEIESKQGSNTYTLRVWKKS